MPTTTISNSLQNIANRLLGTNFTLTDPTSQMYPYVDMFDRIRREADDTRRVEKGVKRTDIPAITKESKIDMTGEDGFSILLSIVSPDGNPNKPGFTPQESFYLYGTEKIDRQTGYAKEAGVILSADALNNNTGLDKISRTTLSSSDDGKTILLRFNRESVKGKQNVWGSQNVNLQPTSGGWVNPLHYVNFPENKNDKTGLPKELGDFPFNYNDKFGANYFSDNGAGAGTSNLKFTTPANKVDGPTNDGINSKKEVFDYFVSSKDDNIRFGGYEQYDFLHNLDRLNALENPQAIPKDVYLASFLDIKDHEDPVMFAFDLMIDFETSPLFNGAILDFINKYGSVSPEIEARKKVYQNFITQFKKYFKLRTSTDPSSAEEQTEDEKLVPTGNPQQRGRNIIKTYYLKKIAGLDALVEGSVTNLNDNVKSMVDYGKDLIKLTLYEDVTVNTGYLASLYKILTWSRLNGKQLIPENLLRFDCKIIINEVRNYNKIVKNANNEIEGYADDLNKYIYKLYDCQFVFDKVSHGDDIDMWNLAVEKDFDIAFYYKYSTLIFEKFYSNKPNSIRKWSFDNKEEDPISYNENTTSPGLKYYEKFSPGVVQNSDLVDATLRNMRRQLNESAIVSDTNLEVTRGLDEQIRGEFDTLKVASSLGGEPNPQDYFEQFSSLQDIKLINEYSGEPNRGAFETYEESEETNLELLNRQERNRQITQATRNKSIKTNVGSTNRQRDLISRTVERIIEGRDQLVIGPISNNVA